MVVSPGLLPPISTYIVPGCDNSAASGAPCRRLPAIKELSLEDRPREKLLQRGAAALSHAELLAILLNTGNKRQSAVDLAQEMLYRSRNSLYELALLDVAQLKKFPGIGEKKAITILAALELARRKLQLPASGKPVLRSSAEAASIMRPILQHHAVESFWVLFLNQANKLLHYSCFSTGGMTGTVVDGRLIFREALQQKATRLMLCHNHPSGNLRPSSADLKVTQRLVEAGKFLEIDILDHLIIADEGYFSFREDGLLAEAAKGVV